jgi:hypothetical protein
MKFDLRYVVLSAVAMSFVYLWFVYKRSLAPDYDINEGVQSSVEHHIDIDALRHDPDGLDTFRDEVSFVGFEECYVEELGTRAESWCVDSNGAIVTIQTTFEGPGAVDPDSARHGPWLLFSRDRSFPNRVGERNARIKENARWLADTLDVPFEE